VGETIVTSTPKQDQTPSAKPKRKLSGAARRRLKKAKEGLAGETSKVTPSQTPKITSEVEGSQKKRAHTSDEVVSKPPTKRNKMDYRQAVEEALQVAIVFRDNYTRKMNENEGNHIRRNIISLIDMMPSGSETQGPQFDRSGLDQGVFRITCSDQRSLNWLKEAVQGIEPIEGSGFTVVELAELNSLNKVRVWIPGIPDEPRLIFSRLAKQNRGLNTSGWRVLHRKEQRRPEGKPQGQPDGQLLVLGVDDESLKVLRELGGKVYLELSKVTFMLPSQGQVNQ